ncbi:MAG: hypothetical protein KatS3mg045_0709 [Bellilinea sp.]|nr:MAG: hypothetical protein KatS3mg045_0709 [Bellilinea sp.]
MPLKGNRKVALSVDAKQQVRYRRVDTLELEAMQSVTVYLEGVAFSLLFIQQVFTTEDGSTGIQYLVTSDTTLDGNGIAASYQKRWNVEPYYKSLKQNASLEKSPTQTVTTQTNHFLRLCAVTSNSNRSKAIHPTQSLCTQSQTISARPSCCLMPICKNSSPLNWLRMVS